MNALKTIRVNNEPGFLTFGIGLNKLEELEWNSMNKDGWGILSSKEEKWRYISDVKDGLRHGSGIVTYAGGSRYAGNWFRGLGRLINKKGTGHEQVYIADVVREDGVVVNTTVRYNDLPVKFASIGGTVSPFTLPSLRTYLNGRTVTVMRFSYILLLAVSRPHRLLRMGL
ncbi:hypothetical protein AX15_002033 [Amanita polypyramis BW_CC]|nr:hypothetical protein AX15_002033 [Amanita polypyramis BW_CC]